MHFAIIQEAVHSVAMEHASGCDCDTCLAANGDSDALARIYAAMRQT